MTYYLFLDDERFPENVTWIVLPDVDWVIVRDQTQFQNVISERGLPTFISFDNDLGLPDKGEGYSCAHWLVDQILDGNIDFNDDFDFALHSKNNIAAESIKQLLTNFINFMKN